MIFAAFFCYPFYTLPFLFSRKVWLNWYMKFIVQNTSSSLQKVHILREKYVVFCLRIYDPPNHRQSVAVHVYAILHLSIKMILQLKLLLIIWDLDIGVLWLNHWDHPWKPKSQWETSNVGFKQVCWSPGAKVSATSMVTLVGWRITILRQRKALVDCECISPAIYNPLLNI